MTIEQAIDELSTIGQRIGFNAKVQAWYIGGRDEVKPLDTFTATRIEEGRYKQSNERTAVIRIQP